MLSLIAIITFILCFMILYTFLKSLYSNTFAVQKRLDQVGDEFVQMQEEKSFIQSYLMNLKDKSKQKSQSKRNNKKGGVIQRQLEESGLIRKYSVAQWLVLKNMIMFVLCGGSVVLLAFTKNNLLTIAVIEIILFMAVQIIFRFSLASAITKRKQEILKSLPYTLDLVTVSVEAGLSFDGAIAKVMDTTDNGLTYEFSRALKEIRMGIERKKALRALSDRCNVKELTTVVNALIQADDLGVSLGKVLRIQSEQVREFRKQAAREKSMKAPVKMLFPLIFFIFPTVFIVILGPAVIRIVDFFR